MKFEPDKLTEEDHKNLGNELKCARNRFGELGADLRRRYGKKSKAATKAFKIYEEISQLRDMMENQIFADHLAFSGDIHCYYGPVLKSCPPYQIKSP